jgi:uncharacterized protein (DUF1501 family)
MTRSPARPRADARAAGPPDAGPTRRDLLRYLAYGSAGALALPWMAGCSEDRGPAAVPSRARTDGPPLLVVLELGGGNDGLSTLVPFEDGRYHDLRPTLALGADDVIDLGDGWGLHDALRRTAALGPALVSGVGSLHPSLSHFDMLDRWWRGRPDPLVAAEQGSLGTGFLGRLCDALRGDERFTGLSISFGSLSGLRSEHAVTTGLPTAQPGTLTGGSRSGVAIRAAFERFAQGAGTSDRDGPEAAAARTGIERMLWMEDLIGALPSSPAGYPDTDLGTRLAIASRVLRSDAGVRVVHVPVGGGLFDTHQRHAEVHPQLLAELDAGLGAFAHDLAQHGLDRRVLIATTSEFGRRPQEHDGGLDHGTASTMLLVGPVQAGRHGEPSSLVRFDDTDNLVSTIAFDRYLATLATWMEVEPAEVLVAPGGARPPEPIPGVLAPRPRG